MDINEWEVWYAEILETLGFSREGDEKTADLLDEILDKKGCLTIDEFFDEIMDKKCTEKFIVFGAGPSLKKHINFVKENYDLNDYLLVSADGATTAMLEEDLVPDIVATDLDGKMSDLLTANSLGSYFVIHAHGNNEELIDTWTTSFDKIIGIIIKNTWRIYRWGQGNVLYPCIRCRGNGSCRNGLWNNSHQIFKA